MAIALLYADDPRKAFIIDVNVAKISKFNARRIRAVHQKNINQGTAQMASYTWIGERVSIVQKVVVSGVWHPCASTGKAFELSSKFNFLAPLNL
jgi:hypothetical protein